MKKVLGFSAASIAAVFMMGNAWAAGPECTTEDPSTWMTEQDFIEKATSMGYDANNFAVTEGGCYTLTKIDAADANDLEYFDPVSGEPVVQ